MKADQFGTYTEQIRHTMGWMTPTERKKDGRHTRCATCRYFHREFGISGCGGSSMKIRCVHLMAGGEKGHATTDNAVCAKWEIKG